MTIDRPELVLATLMTETVVGYPRAVFEAIGHPVSWIGRMIAGLEAGWNRGSPRRRRLAGVALLAVAIAIVGVVGWSIARLAGHGWGVVALVLVATTGLAQRSLDDHVRAVERPLRAGDLAAARAAVARIVGRDTDALDEAGVATAAIESLAESFCDGVVAPAFWFLVAGLPGLLICKAVNTADSMIGHRDARYADFGWAAAHADDAVNLVPARIAGLLVALAGSGGFATMWRDARRHASPNGGWPEAAMAGALGRRLGGPVSYDGERAVRAMLGDGPSPDAGDLTRALWIYRRACVLLWLMIGGVAWLR